MIIFSGGTGTPKLLRGLKKVFDEEELKIIVNTAEDVWISGNLVCPDIDAVIYSLSGIIDEKRWWGIRNDSFNTHDTLKLLNCDELLKIGDRDRATHIVRTELLRRKESLTDAISFISKNFNIKAKILPMTDEPVSVRTKILTTEGELHFQDFWIRKKGKPEVLDVIFEGIEKAKPSKEVVDALKYKNEKFVIIGPSNPITSIAPILNLKGMKDLLKKKKVVAISPIIGNKPVSGPAAKFMQAKGFDASPYGVLKCYEDFLDALIIDKSDKCPTDKNVEVVKTDIIIRNNADSEKLAIFLKNFIDLRFLT